MEERNILIVINPVSGRSTYEQRLRTLEARLSLSELNYSKFYTEIPGKGKLARYLSQNEGINELIVLGGDGTLNYVVNELRNRELLISIVSNGTGNDSVKSLHGELSFEGQVDIALKGKVERFDLGTCNGRRFINGLGIGFDGQVVQRMMNRKRKAGSRIDDLLTVLRTVAGFKERELWFSLDGRQMKRKILLMTVSNGTTFGGGFVINPHASSRDGSLDLCILNEITPLMRYWHLPKLKTGAHRSLKAAEFFKAKRVKIEASDELVAHLDGEFLGHPPFELSILPGALKLRVPG